MIRPRSASWRGGVFLSGLFSSYIGGMPLYDIAFYAASFFLAGVAFASLGASAQLILWSVAIAMGAMMGIGILKKSPAFFILAGLCFTFFAGFFYYHWYLNFTRPTVTLGVPSEFRGTVTSYPEWRMASQKFELALEAPNRGSVTVLAPAYPRYSYGDVLMVGGTASEAQPGRVQMTFPKIERVGRASGNIAKSALFAWRAKMIGVFYNSLPPESAALLAGLTFGDRAGFSKEFQTELQESGTTHIVALSGYNISLIVGLVGVLFSYFLSRRASFFASIVAVVLFVISTGAEASAARAAIMGIIALLAIQVGRLYSFRNAITFAALFMVLLNPRTLVFDIGFQLSFAALLGIVYLLPAIKLFFNISPTRGFLGWRENALASCAAELAVLPILLKYFGAFSLFSVFANVLILEIVPHLTILGFVLGLLGYLSKFLGVLLGMGMGVLLQYVIGVIHLFARIALPVSFSASTPMIVAYYMLLSGFVFWAYYKKSNIKNKK